MQLDITKDSVSVVSPGLYRLTAKVQAWPDAVSKIDDNRIYNKNFAENVKQNVPGKTNEQLVQEATAKLQTAIQTAVDKFEDETAKLAHQFVDDAMMTLNNNIIHS